MDATITPEQRKTLLKRWLELLRSNQYKQGRSFLHTAIHDEHYYCCLGVACEAYKQVIDPALKVHHTFRELDDGSSGEIVHYDGAYDYLPETIQRALGLNYHSGACIKGPFHGLQGETIHSLTEANDTAGKNFAEIAQLIVSNADVLFEDKGKLLHEALAQ